MKANEAPEKLYIENRKILYSCLTAYTNKRYDNDIEYTRTDVFIEKACEWLKENADMYEAFDSESKSYYMDKDKLVENFKEYMKGD